MTEMNSATAKLPLTAAYIQHALEQWLEIEFTLNHVDELACSIAALSRQDQDLLLGWVSRIATTNTHLAHQFAIRALPQFQHMVESGYSDRRMIDAWALHTMDAHDQGGARAAFHVVNEVGNFATLSHEHAVGAIYEEVSSILLTFVRGLSGRQLKLEMSDTNYTDSATLYLPPIVASLQKAEDNFILCKVMVTLLWAQTRFGTFRADLIGTLNSYDDSNKALRIFNVLETIRMEACISRELPGLHREMQRLKKLTGWRLPENWAILAETLAQPKTCVQDSLRLLERAYLGAVPNAPCYQGELRLDEVLACSTARIEAEKILLRVKLAKELEKQDVEKRSPAPNFELKQVKEREQEGNEWAGMEIILDDIPIAPPAGINQLLTSIFLDLGEIPEEYLVAAGPGEYDPERYNEKSQDSDDVWQGTYHEEGATLYPEWDFGRRLYRKNWCVVREKDVPPVEDDFVLRTLQKYSGLVKHLRRTFEAMREENRIVKREISGDDVDIDALVEALADTLDGSEMSDRLFARMQRNERNIAVMFMVDMSGSTNGWINDAERESLVLLCEVLEKLGDRYAIYGFSGTTRKRCELYRIKQFNEPYNDMVKARISGIRAQDYTRMGFAIRHLSSLLNQIDARSKILITLSDGKPDDYNDGYRGKYGIEDTRKALVEAKRSGIHPFCITIDTQGRDYLPYMYGAANYVVIDEVGKLPLKVATIYRRLTG
jgi:nitric oxide reductase NorD protein